MKSKQRIGSKRRDDGLMDVVVTAHSIHEEVYENRVGTRYTKNFNFASLADMETMEVVIGVVVIPQLRCCKMNYEQCATSWPSYI